MKKTILLLMGPSGCGKSTLEKLLVENHDAYRVVSTSTRQQRRNETNGYAYHFVSQTIFDKMLRNDEFIQTTDFAGNYYGTTISEYTTNHDMAILSITPTSASDFVPLLRETFPDYDIKIIFFDITIESLRENMLKRGDTEKEVELRMTHDDLAEQFKNSGFIPDIVVTDDMLTNDLDQKIMDKLKLNE